MSPTRSSKPKPRSARPDPLTGRVVARCRIEEYLDSGKSAVVYRGTHLGLERTVAVKILKPEAAAQPVIVDSFRTEARAIARLDSENVLKVYDVVDEGDLHCMVMELLEGESVLDLITRRERLSQVDSLRIIRQAAVGLKTAHARGIVHRDVKPQNLVVLPDGTVKLVDFGLAVDSAGAGGRVGTPHYVAPETASSAISEPGSDVYSLGITLYHLLVGQPPYAGMSVQQALRAHMAGTHIDLEGARPGVSPAVVALFADMTRCDPLVRLSSTEVVRRVDAIGGKRLVRKRSLAGRGRRAVAGPLAVVVAVAVAAAVLVFLVSRGREGEPAGVEAAAPPEPVEPVVPVVVPRLDPAEAAAKAREAERLEREAQALLDGGERWARGNWRDREDTIEVIRRYREISGAHRNTEAAGEAQRRIRAIEAGELHPHPDLAWSTPAEVESARAAWTTREAEVLALVGARRYREAKEALPPVVSDPAGELEAELSFQHARLDQVLRLPATLHARLAADAELPRALQIGKGEVTVLAIDEEGFEVLEGRTETSVRWEDVEPESVARLALRAFADADLADLLPLLAFCSVHGLRDAFFQATMTLDLALASHEHQGLYRVLRSRWR